MRGTLKVCMMTSNLYSKIAWVVCAALLSTTALAQQPDAPAPEPTEGMITLNFPDNVDMKVLIDYVGKRRNINFIYDEQTLANKKLTINAPQRIPADSLMTLLESALKMKGLVITSTEIPGMKRIEIAQQLTALAAGPQANIEAGDRPTLVTMRVYELRHADTTRVEQVIKPFLSANTANITALAEHDIVIITDYAVNMPKIEQMMALVDRPGRQTVVRFVKLEHLAAEDTATRLNELLRAQAGAGQDAPAKATGGAKVVADDRTNQLVVLGSAKQVEQAVSLIQSLDVPLGVETRIYRFVIASPEQVDRLVTELIGELAAERLYKSATDADANLLIATTTPEIHKQIDSLKQRLDEPLPEEQTPIRFYKLENAKAADVLGTLQSIAGQAGLGDVSIDGVAADKQAPGEKYIEGPRPEQVNRVGSKDREDDDQQGIQSVTVGDTRVMADEPSNTIIVVAEPSVHPVYEKLIRRLDVRRPQVLVEATVVTLDTTDDFRLGVEISRIDDFEDGDGQVLNFSSFGLSTRDSDTGRLTITPGVGFNGAVLSADIADIVIQALEADSRARVVSRPSVLINDNATGELTSKNEEPFASVNASTTVATTSFAGFAQAGTNIRITPQISEGEHLKLEYEIELSSFTGEDASDSLPPARQTNSLISEATIPNGHTIVVGGLTRENYMNTIDRIPVLGRIPILEYAFSNRSEMQRKLTLFVFIRAVILRDDKFKDLKVLSQDAAARAELPGDYPESEPVEIP